MDLEGPDSNQDLCKTIARLAESKPGIYVPDLGQYRQMNERSHLVKKTISFVSGSV